MRKEKIEELNSYISELKTVKKTLMPEEFIYDQSNCPTQRKGFIQVEKYLCELANGRVIIREKIMKGNKDGSASIVVPITNNNHIVFVIQPRTNTKQSVCIELPAGYIEKNEKPIDAAKRELIEETGYVPGSIEYLDSFYQDQGCSSAYNYSFLAIDCKRLQKQNLDKDEIIRYFECTIEEAFELIEKGYISDIQSKYTLEKAKQLINRR